MSHIVVLAAGLGGMPAAIELRTRLGGPHRITLIASSPHLEFAPVNPWIAVGWRQCSAARSAVQDSLESLGVQLLAEAATGIDTLRSRLHLRSGSALAYDYLLIATGPVDAPLAIPGFDLLGTARGLCKHQQGAHAWSEYQRLLSDPGPVVVAVVGSPSSAGHAYELALTIDADLRARRLRDRAPLTLLTSEPSVGHMGLDGIQSATTFLTRELRERQIQWLCDTQIVCVETDRLQVSDCASPHMMRGRRLLPFKYTMIVPAMEPLAAVKQVPGLCDADGRVLVDRMHRSRRYSNIFSIGNAGATLQHGGIEQGTGAAEDHVGAILSTLGQGLVKDSRRGDRNTAIVAASSVAKATHGRAAVGCVSH